MSKVIALVDGSTYSQSVCDHAAWVAKGKGWPVEVLHVIGRRDEATDPRNLSGNIGLGARTALLITRGFRDVLHIGTQVLAVNARAVNALRRRCERAMCAL